MERVKIQPRNQWQKAVEQLGFGFHTTDIAYWDESAYYRFDSREIEAIEKATAALWDMCLGAVQHVIDQKLYSQFSIPENFIPYIEKTWNDEHPAIYGRFDLCYKQGKIKMLEFNADTPTSLYEAGIVQWFWLQDHDKNKDQFNSIHEKLIAYWKYLKPYLHPGKLHFTCLKDTLEDLTNTEYMRDCAIQAGIDTKLIFIDDIGWDDEQMQFTDLENEPITNLFKLYPWEWLAAESFGSNILTDKNNSFWIEPCWKMILSNKAILPILWQLYPENEYLLPAYFTDNGMKDYVKKPILSREGANIELVKHYGSVEKTAGEYGQEGYIYQQLFELPEFDNNYPVIGSWIIGQEPAGMGIREASGLITNNQSRFVPHLIG
ncbi:MAG TPA: glutathionylspermidine synthase family protein [Ferruginibacter sp.]|nr:glutathionylspermidine synthase family protein [Ferruginibacter sp.]